jgi:hypothetical protein
MATLYTHKDANIRQNGDQPDAHHHQGGHAGVVVLDVGDFVRCHPFKLGAVEVLFLPFLS